LVFLSIAGTPLSHRNVVRSFEALLKRAGLPAGTRLYDLRHTCATLLLNGNVHPKYVQELLGHASIALTLDTYSRVPKGMDGGIGGAIDEALGQDVAWTDRSGIYSQPFRSARRAASTRLRAPSFFIAVDR